MFNIWEVVDKIAAIAKKELFYIWPFGLSAYLAGVVFIDRSNAKGAYRQLQQTSEIMVKNKVGTYYNLLSTLVLWYFPAATITQTRGYGNKIYRPVSLKHNTIIYSFFRSRKKNSIENPIKICPFTRVEKNANIFPFIIYLRAYYRIFLTVSCF